ncbi:MAG TPA: hypothetical protein VGR27_15455 [Longimicrobiaceae bacterium]|nr:hypothetical protein [Longimicrobiaceae bacterium]
MAITRTYEEVLDLIVAVTSPQRLLRFRLPMPARVRMAELVALAERGEMSIEDAAEMELYLDLQQTFADARARARQQPLAPRTEAA